MNMGMIVYVIQGPSSQRSSALFLFKSMAWKGGRVKTLVRKQIDREQWEWKRRWRQWLLRWERRWLVREYFASWVVAYIAAACKERSRRLAWQAPVARFVCFT